MEKLFYRDYVKTTFWELRKRRYFARYGDGCTICGDTDRVEIAHIKHGDYGHERDSDLVALCRLHHATLEEIGVDGTDVERMEYIEGEVAKRNVQRRERKEVMPLYDYSPSLFSSIHMILDAMARPIWRLFYGVFRW